MKTCIALLVLLSAAWSSGRAQDVLQPVDNPITRQQFEAYMHDSMLLDATRRMNEENLEKRRGTMPPWLPNSVWVDFKKRVAEIDYISLLLPLFQKMLTERDGAALDLMFSGPTGHEYAQAVLDSRLAAMQGGLQGSAAETAAMNSPAEAKVHELQQKRAHELTPEERASVQSLGAKRSLKLADGLTLDDEQNVLIQNRFRDLIRQAAKDHQAEMAAAEKAYAAKHPGGA